jgi:hypothetical protein
MFQADYEQRLVNTGFTFEAFREDRREPANLQIEYVGPERRLAADREWLAGA